MSGLTDEERAAFMARYEAAAHAMQSGVAIMLANGSKDAEPKHLRVGINTAHADGGSLARLLIAKGIISEREYYEALVAGMEQERDSYTTSIQALLGSKKLGLG